MLSQLYAQMGGAGTASCGGWGRLWVPLFADCHDRRAVPVWSRGCAVGVGMLSDSVSHGGSIWVGQLDLDDGHIEQVSGRAIAQHAIARVMIRIHGAPLGYIETPLYPTGTLSSRVVAAAEVTLVRQLRQHRDSDDAGDKPSWAAQVTCPRNFPALAGTGLSVIVCTRDRPAPLSQCLRALQLLEYEPLDILVVDNAPATDATQSLVEQLTLDDPRIRYSREPNPGLSRARNHGLAAAKYDLVAFTDDDIVVDRQWATAVVAGFTADPETVCVTGLVASRSLETNSERYFDSRYPWGEAFDARRYDLITHRDQSPLYPFKAGIFGTGANFAVRRDVVDHLGGFDPLLGAGGLGRGGEDLDMFLRIILAGGRLCYLPAALVWHQHRADESELAEQVYSYGHGLGAYLAKRLLTHEMPIATLARSLAQSKVMARHMREASNASQMKTRGRRLAANEAWGILAGAYRFYRATRAEGPMTAARSQPR